MKQLTPMDSQFFYFEAPNQPMMIGSLWLCDQTTAPDGLVRHKDILQYISDRLNTTSYFRRRLEQAPFQLDDPYWLQDENFDVEYHVRHVGLPQPGDWRQLCIFTARTMSRSVDMERAPWEIYIIEGVNNVEGVPPGSFAVLIRFHHAYVDGKAGLELTTALWEDTPDHEYGRRDLVEVAERPPTRLEMWARTAPRMIGQSFRSMRAGIEITRKSYELAKRLRGDARPEQRRVPKTIFNTTISPHRSYAGYELTIAELKRMRQLCTGSSLNDVIISLIAGGMRRYLNAHNALPSNESLVSMCPVSIRPEDARKDGGNLVSAMFVGIGTDIADPVERLKAVQRRTQHGIPLAKEVLCDLNNAYGDMVPAYMRNMGAALSNKLRLAGKYPMVNTIITNVPGIPGMVPKYFAGATIRAVSPIVPISDGVAISHGITGIYDRICIGILADRKVVPDMDFYVSCLAESTREYLAATEAVEEAKAAAAKEVTAVVEPSSDSKSGKSTATKTTTRKAANTADKQAAEKAATKGDDAVVEAGRRTSANGG
ncbi:wax ester/triacylglycerol synthase family O-acyltransferase [Halopseudomonas salegens]|uniref:diacylglycerol O-acyltransferase n=1 Tax=Halopseudomonas salegens TaxID=1434072 RepID=A0A1H2ECH5_9GAMM|nr:wax ester/triacylglycerol synthase family O-acyltransferase [Halopseudomonas salegens]SDT92811.1 Diacylglycerol O-acyltransferase [Halopseudomonas salegens]